MGFPNCGVSRWFQFLFSLFHTKRGAFCAMLRTAQLLNPCRASNPSIRRFEQLGSCQADVRIESEGLESPDQAGARHLR